MGFSRFRGFHFAILHLVNLVYFVVFAKSIFASGIKALFVLQYVDSKSEVIFAPVGQDIRLCNHAPFTNG